MNGQKEREHVSTAKYNCSIKRTNHSRWLSWVSKALAEWEKPGPQRYMWYALLRGVWKDCRKGSESLPRFWAGEDVARAAGEHGNGYGDWLQPDSVVNICLLKMVKMHWTLHFKFFFFYCNLVYKIKWKGKAPIKSEIIYTYRIILAMVSNNRNI